jgi:RNA polymerase sigma-70 factor (ECF subfamily)
MNAGGVSTDDLIRRYQAGQTDLFDVLYERYKDYVYRVAYSMTRHVQEAEEVVQETFLDLLKALPRYQVDGSARFETWLYRVTANRCKMRWRRKRLPTVERDDWADEAADPLEQVPDERDEHNPVEATEQAETRRRIWRAVGRLSDAAREVVLLRYGQGFSYLEIADALEIKLGTVKSRLNAAHRQLQELIAANGHLADEIAGRKRGQGRGMHLVFLCFAGW